MLEPRIIYGSFDYNGIPTQPGGRASLVGYGITHGYPDIVVGSPVLDDPVELERHMESVKAQIEQKLLVKRYDDMEDKRPLFIGLPIDDSTLYTDAFHMSFSLEGSRRTLSFDFGNHGLTYGMHDRPSIQSAIGYYGSRTIASWEGEIITLDDGFQFAVAPRYTETAELKISLPNDEWKKNLVLNLDKRLGLAALSADSTVQ